VKPENVCIMSMGDSNNTEICLIDFGHARPFPKGMTTIVGEAGSDSYAAVSSCEVYIFRKCIFFDDFFSVNDLSLYF
jgi:hypothetical protein